MLFSVICRATDIVSLFSGAVPFVIVCLALLALLDLGFSFYRNKKTSSSKDSYVFWEFD